MGTDLKLYPIMYGRPANYMIAQGALSCDREYPLFGAITAAKPRPLGLAAFNGPDAIAAGGESTWGPMTVDAYGAPLTFLTAAELVSAFGDRCGGHINDAIFAFLQTLPDWWVMVLYWH